MCTISYQKCVCFVFLVVLAVLSCSGFRIDNLAMTDVSKRNAHASAGLLEALFANSTHRLRHRRYMMPHVQPTRPRRRRQCPELDASWKAYAADAVAVAKVESKSANCKENCTVQFTDIHWLKSKATYHDQRIRLNFRVDRANYCEYDDLITRSHSLVRTKINQSKYILFLNTSGPHNYTAAFAPEPNRTRTLRSVNRVTSPDFRPKPVRLEMVSKGESRSKRLKLACKVRGFPIPIIYWKVNNTLLHPNDRIRITQKKRKSTLVIRNLNEADWGQYKCVARGVDGKNSHVAQTIGRPKEKPGISPTVSDSDRKPCNDSMKQNYCLNGGTCFLLESLREYSCECANGFTGHQCEKKSSDQSSMYRQTPIYTCKIGLYTKYDNC